LLEEKYIESIF